MALSDPLGDLLTRIRNAQRQGIHSITSPASRLRANVLEVLKREGYIGGYDLLDDGRQGVIRIQLKYGPRGEPLVQLLKRESTPGRRVYQGVEDLPRPMEGLGIAIVSTSKGVLSDRQCREMRVGGELLATVE